jgi:hypothetical protein
MRDKEDLEPLPGTQGGENIPLEVMVAMARSIRAIPNSMLKGVTLEMDLAINKLEQLQKQDPPLAQPNVEPAVQAPSQILGNIIGSQRGLKDLSDLSTEDVIDILRAASHKARGRMAAEPEFIGPWIPSEADLTRLTSVNGNGNGGKH